MSEPARTYSVNGPHGWLWSGDGEDEVWYVTCPACKDGRHLPAGGTKAYYEQHWKSCYEAVSNTGTEDGS